MSIQIQQKIVGYEVVNPEQKPQAVSAQSNAAAADNSVASTEQARIHTGNITRMHEKIERSEVLSGNTYKIRTPVSEHAFYVTINDITFNPGTPYEKRRPFEMFVNSKNMDHYQWISALTLIVSAVFRKGGDITFLVKELQSVFDPKGGYFRKGGKFMPSLVAEIGDAIETHLIHIGLITPGLDQHQQKLVEQKRKEFEQQQSGKVDATPDSNDEQASMFPKGAQLCNKCNHIAMVVMDNCLTCLNCGESKCG